MAARALDHSPRPRRWQVQLAFVALGAASFNCMAACGSYAPGGRSDDDFACIGSREKRTSLEELKYVALGGSGDGHAILGAELRERLEHADPPLLGLRARRAAESVLLQRLLLHADARFGSGVRAFVQLGEHRGTGRDGRRVPTDESGLDLQQAFFEIAVPGSAPRRGRVRLGRQELAFGSQRLTTTREGPNLRLAFDAVRATVETNGWVADAFVARPIDPSRGTFDDRMAPDERFAGLYATRRDSRFGPAGGWDVYSLWLDRDQARFDTVVAAERRVSVGARVFGGRESWDWDWEAVLQRGRFAGGPIEAWTLATVTGYSFAGTPGRPRVALSINVASGDGRAGDGRLGTFNPIYPKAPYFTEAAVNAPANMVDVHPSLELSPRRGLSLKLAVDVLWRHRTADSFYTQPLLPLVPGAASRSRYVGTQTELRATWTPTPHWVLATALVHFEAGTVVRDAGGRDQRFIMSSVMLRL